MDQDVDLEESRGRANLAALLAESHISRVTVNSNIITLITDKGEAIFRLEGSHEDLELTVQFISREEGYIPCRWCGTRTPYHGIRECDRCFQIHDKIRGADPDILIKMVEELNLASKMIREE